MRAVFTVVVAAISIQTSAALADGVAAMNKGDAAAAVALLEQAVASQPTSRLALLHLANAQRMNQQSDEAAATLKQVLKLNPQDDLALWNLGVLPGDEGITYLRRLTEVFPRYPDAMNALATIQTMRARMQYTAAMRAANVRAEDQGWIADAAARATLRAAAWTALDEAQAASQRARAQDGSAFEPLVFISLVLRMKAAMADSIETSKRWVEEADRLTAESMVLRRQHPPVAARIPLDPSSPPPAFPKPGAPPPPLPK
jgi:tetratricopeptide (TPR) repeat protein